MNDNLKKAGLVALIAVAIVAAVFGAKQAFGGDQIQVEKTVAGPPGFKSEKEQFLEDQAKAKGAPDAGKGDGGARDLGGDLGGK